MHLKARKGNFFFWKCKSTKCSFPFQFSKAKLLVWFSFNGTKHLNEFGGTGTPRKSLNESTQSSQNVQQRFPNQKENQVPHELCDLSSARKARIQTRRKRKPLGNTTKNNSTITEQVQQQIWSWLVKQENKIPTEGLTHTRPLDALGLECEINGEKRTPEG